MIYENWMVANPDHSDPRDPEYDGDEVNLEPPLIFGPYEYERWREEFGIDD